MLELKGVKLYIQDLYNMLLDCIIEWSSWMCVNAGVLCTAVMFSMLVYCAVY